MNPANIMMWEGLLTQLASLGVTSYKSIKALQQDAGLDDATIEALKPKWDDLYNRVKAASRE
jgi:hypothetical protein